MRMGLLQLYVVLACIAMITWLVEGTLVEAQGEIQNTPALDKNNQEYIVKLAANVDLRTAATIERLENIAKRIGSRASTTKEGSEDKQIRIAMYQAMNHVAVALPTLNNAREILNGLDQGIAGVVSAPDPIGAWVNVKNSYAEIKKLIYTAEGELWKAVNILRDPTIVDVEEYLRSISAATSTATSTAAASSTASST